MENKKQLHASVLQLITSSQNLVTLLHNCVTTAYCPHPNFVANSIVMKTIELKTNIMCGACVAKVTPTLNETVGEQNWKVDTATPNKVLTVSSETLTERDVINAVEKAGYKAEKLT